jgi:hypothetical protein
MLRRMRSTWVRRASSALCCTLALAACSVSRTPDEPSRSCAGDACPTIPAPGGPCAHNAACCTLQGDRASDCLEAASRSSALDDEEACIDALSDPDVLAHHRVPCDTSVALAESEAQPPGSRPSIRLEGAPCLSDEDCGGDPCVGSVRVGAASMAGRCIVREMTPQVEDEVVGTACSSDTECGGGSCERSTPLRTPFPEGYCSARCYEDDTCGAGGACILPLGSIEPGHCYQRCSDDGDCPREGYRCTPLGDGERVVGVCYPRRDALPDGVVGSACERDTDCADGAAVCFEVLQLSLDNELVAAPGGYCSAPCLFDVDCGAGAQCVSGVITGGQCLASCNAVAPCRDGYECVAHLRDGDPAATVCTPK